jgi:hypothetical protein
MTVDGADITASRQICRSVPQDGVLRYGRGQRSEPAMLRVALHYGRQYSVNRDGYRRSLLYIKLRRETTKTTRLAAGDRRMRVTSLTPIDCRDTEIERSSEHEEKKERLMNDGTELNEQ